ncbi:MAG: peptide chain release factor-like protein [Deltaproteobacteria bacterium]|nr:peptide chain release factor-like protein [Deltaproteobacteria bacterium]
MSLFNVSQEKERALLARMERLGVAEDDLRETFVRSSGPGGQKVNKTSSCVQLLHIPSGLAVKCQQSRSQALNRFLARRLLLDRIERIQQGKVLAEKQRVEKIKRQKRRRSRRAKEKILKDKHDRSLQKALRSKITPTQDFE